MCSQKHWVVLWNGHLCWYYYYSWHWYSIFFSFYSTHLLVFSFFLSSYYCFVFADCYFCLHPTGLQTKLMQNCGRTKFKRTSIDKLMNTLVLWVRCFCFLNKKTRNFIFLKSLEGLQNLNVKQGLFANCLHSVYNVDNLWNKRPHLWGCFFKTCRSQQIQNEQKFTSWWESSHSKVEVKKEHQMESYEP